LKRDFYFFGWSKNNRTVPDIRINKRGVREF